jgi:zinc protease
VRGTRDRAPARPVDRTRPPESGPPPSLRLPPIERFALSNGVPVLLVEKHDLPLVAIELFFSGGASAVVPARAGLASLTMDMLDEGAGERSALAVSAELERLGVTLQLAAGYDASHVEVLALRTRLAETLDLLGDVVLQPTFLEHEVERVRQERIDLSLELLAEPRSVANDAFARAIYGPAHPWGPPLLGTRRALAALGRADVAAHHERNHHAGNATMVVAGDVTAGALRELLEPRFGAWERRPAPALDLAAPPALERASLWLIDRPGAAQSELRVGCVAAARTAEDYFAVIVLNTVLGGAFTSRLNAKLREEKGFTYGARSAFHTRRWPGPFVAQCAVHTPVTAEAVAVILEQIERLREEPVPADELERAMRYVALRLPQRFETVGDVVGRVAEQVQYGLPDDYWSGYVPRLLEVDAAAVQAAARRYLDSRRMAVVVDGDHKEVQGPLEALGLPLELVAEEVEA